MFKNVYNAYLTCHHRCVAGEEVNWVQCDKCEKWLHLLCIGLSKEEISEDTDYICYECKYGKPPPPPPGLLPEIKLEPHDDLQDKQLDGDTAVNTSNTPFLDPESGVISCPGEEIVTVEEPSRESGTPVDILTTSVSSSPVDVLSDAPVSASGELKTESGEQKTVSLEGNTETVGLKSESGKLTLAPIDLNAETGTFNHSVSESDTEQLQQHEEQPESKESSDESESESDDDDDDDEEEEEDEDDKMDVSDERCMDSVSSNIQDYKSVIDNDLEKTELHFEMADKEKELVNSKISADEIVKVDKDNSVAEEEAAKKTLVHELVSDVNLNNKAEASPNLEAAEKCESLMDKQLSSFSDTAADSEAEFAVDPIKHDELVNLVSDTINKISVAVDKTVTAAEPISAVLASLACEETVPGKCSTFVESVVPSPNYHVQ